MSDFFRFRRYRLELDGVAQGAFDEFVSPSLTTTVEVGDDQLPRPGHAFRSNAILRHGVANTRELFRWFEAVLEGLPMPRTVVLVELGDDGEALVTHTLEAAWPVRIRVATLTADVLFDVDELELATGRWSAGPAPA